MTTEQLCFHIISLSHLSLAVYTPDGAVLRRYQDSGEQPDLLAGDPAFLRKLLQESERGNPLLYLEGDSVVYGLVRDGQQCYILGPCSMGRRMTARELLLRHGCDPKTPFLLPELQLFAFMEWVIMLYEALTGDTTDKTRLLFNSFGAEAEDISAKQHIHAIFHAWRENGLMHNPYEQEKREQESIRTGDEERLQAAFHEVYAGQLGTLSRDPLRQYKDLAIVLVTLGCRSAMEGGLNPELAYTMSDGFIQRIEECGSGGKAVELGRLAELSYCRKVHELLEEQRVTNPAINRCKELVYQHLHEKISIQELAEELALNPAYLSQRFRRETGMTLSDYIMKEKIRFAQQELIYTDASYEKIAYTFGFSSQSHFGRVFKKWTGITPKQYREEQRGDTAPGAGGRNAQK